MAETKIGNATPIELLADVNTAAPQQKIYPIEQDGQLPAPHRSNNGQILDGGVATLWKKSDTTTGAVSTFYTKAGDKFTVHGTKGAYSVKLNDAQVYTPPSGQYGPGIGFIASTGNYIDIVPSSSLDVFYGLYFISSFILVDTFTVNKYGKVIVSATTSYTKATANDVRSGCISRSFSQTGAPFSLYYIEQDMSGYYLKSYIAGTEATIASLITPALINGFQVQVHAWNQGNYHIVGINRRLPESSTGYPGNLIWYGTAGGAFSQSAVEACQISPILLTSTAMTFVGMRANNAGTLSYTTYACTGAGWAAPSTTVLPDQGFGNAIGGFFMMPGWMSGIKNFTLTNAEWSVTLGLMLTGATVPTMTEYFSANMAKLTNSADYISPDSWTVIAGNYGCFTIATADHQAASCCYHRTNTIENRPLSGMLNDYGDLYHGYVPCNSIDSGTSQVKLCVRRADGSFNLYYISQNINGKINETYADDNTIPNIFQEFSPNVVSMNLTGASYLVESASGVPALYQRTPPLPAQCFFFYPSGVFCFMVRPSSTQIGSTFALGYTGRYSTMVKSGLMFSSYHATPEPKYSEGPSIFGDRYIVDVYVQSGVSVSPPYVYSVGNSTSVTNNPLAVGTSYIDSTYIPVSACAKIINGGIAGCNSSYYQSQNNQTATYLDAVSLENQYFGYVFTTFFRLFGTLYGFDGTDIYELTTSGATVNNPTRVAKANGLRYLAMAPRAAYFVSDYDNSIWTFNGGRDLQRTYSLNNFDLETLASACFSTRNNELNIVAKLGGTEKILSIREFGDTDTQTVKSITTVLDSPGTPATYTTMLYASDDYIRIVSGPDTTRYTYYPLSGSTVHPLVWRSAYFGSTDNQTIRVSQIVIHGKLETSTGAVPAPAGAFSYSGEVRWNWQTAHASGFESHPFTSVTLDAGGYFRLRVIITQQTVAGGSVIIDLPGTTYKATIVSCVLYISGNGDQLITDSI
jgi:hypothetical protein